jgi:hypothetical protein
MRTIRLRGSRRAADAELPDSAADLPTAPEELAAEIGRLTEANRRRADHNRERRLLALRHRAGICLVDAPPARAGRPEPDFAALSDDLGVPAVSRAALTPSAVRAGILRAGCLLVRALVARADAERLAMRIERAFRERERHDSGRRFDEGLFSEFDPDARYEEPIARHWIKSGGGLLAVDSPALSAALLELFRGAGLPPLAESYLGEPALVAADKSTLRRADPAVSGGWHQDGTFMGDVNALNVWLSLSRCGDVAPGLDIVPRRLEHHVATQTDEAFLDNMVSQRMAEVAAGDTPILRPIFEPGDALLFDELFLHKTASDPAMPQARFAVENWFFGPSAFPAGYIPLTV